MSMRRTTIVLALAVLLAAVTWMTGARGSNANAVAVRPTVFDAAELPVDDVSRIELARNDQATLVFERSDDGAWLQTAPIEHPMDPYSMRQIAVMAREVRVSDALAAADLGESLSLASLGLQPPQATLSMTSPAGTSTVELGRRGVAGRAFVRRDDEVLVVSPELHARVLEMDPREWRDRQLFSNAGVEAVAIELHQGDYTLRLERSGRAWSLVKPVVTRLDAEGRDDLFKTLAGAHSQGFIADDPADLAPFGLDAPPAWVEIVSRPAGAAVETIERLLIGVPIGGSPDWYAMVEGRSTVFRMEGNTLARMFNSDALVDPTGSGVRPADVKSMTVRTESDDFTIERDLDRWIAPARGGREVPADVADQLLRGLTEVRAQAVNVAEFPRDASIGLVILRDFSGRAIDTIRVARAPEPDGRWILENGDNVLRLFPASTQLPLTAAAFGL